MHKNVFQGPLSLGPCSAKVISQVRIPLPLLDELSAKKNWKLKVLYFVSDKLLKTTENTINERSKDFRA